MSRRNPSRLSHVIVRTPAGAESFSTPQSARSSPFKLLQRDRERHGRDLIEQMRAVATDSVELMRAQAELGTVERGVYVEFESDPGFPLKVDSLEARRRGLELVAVSKGDRSTEEGASVRATVFVREGRLNLFLDKFEQYLTEEMPRSGRPRHQELVDSIAEIRLATVRGLWTDEAPFPDSGQRLWWEAWLRVGNSDAERERIAAAFREQARSSELPLGENQLNFPENTVLLLRASADEIGRSVFLINALAELRGAKVAADFFTGMPPAEQTEWVDDAGGRVDPPPEDAPAVCLLDTGVNNEHPLLVPGLRPEDMYSYKPAWGNSDGHGHGTQMAGLGLYGDLVDALESPGAIRLTHRLESVKILNPADPNEPELYGDITAECVARPEVTAPDRHRVYCLTVTTTDFRDRGQPTSWSAAVDQVTSGAIEDEPKSHRLMIISAGNTDYGARVNYPDSNYTDGIHDPAQAWNALTVGAYTDKDDIDPAANPGCKPLAPKGSLCPSSTTSVMWGRTKWPLKPDVVLEGGNMAVGGPYTGPFEHDALRLLTTNDRFRDHMLTTTAETSAASALAARMSAMIFAEYPQFWPETVRGLLVHSADWTPQMLPSGRAMTVQELRRVIERLLRVYGYGVPDLEAALYSARNSLTLISQNAVQPFVKQGSSPAKTNEMHLHDLPWPQEVLRDLGDTEFEMRVTLSYFIEPNPTRRGYKNRYRYMSHGLRFDTKGPTESLDDFRRRINRVAREEVEEFEGGSSDSASWVLGPTLRTRGSLHSDIWRGTAADLAEKRFIAVYPVIGWWRDLAKEEKWNSSARYSLIVTLKTPEAGVDVYTPVANLITV